jgi:hypothetical protein
MKFRARFILIILPLLVVASIIGFVYWRVRVSLESEMTLHAHLQMMEVVKIYLRDNPGKWPKSWEELERTSLPEESQRVYHWPDQSGEFRKRVRIDFGLTRAQVADMNTQNFSAVQAIGPHFVLHDNEVEALLKIAREKDEMPPGKGK